MNPIISFPWCLFLIGVLGLLHAGTLFANADVTLAAGERAPYIGKALPENGYAAELVREAFRRRGYNVTIRFYPLARARMLVRTGAVDGMVPVFQRPETSAELPLVYSAPFPGDTIGFLKKKSLPFSYTRNDLQAPDRLLHNLKRYRIGTVRGGPALPLLDQATSLHKEMVSEDLRNLDKLAADRIQLALIDKYTAADLMVSQRPHLVGDYEFMMPALAHRRFHVAFPANAARHRELAAAFNAGLEEMERDGTVLKILQKHGLSPSPQKDSKKKHLVIGTVNNQDMAIMQSLAHEFEQQHPDIELEWRVLDESTLRLRMLSDLAIADGQFDIMTIGSYETPLWARRGWLRPLDPGENYALDDILAPVRAGMSLDDKLFALPFYAESSMTFYRKDLFARAGLRMPDWPTYDDIMSFAARLHDPKAGVYGVCLRGKPGWGENMAFITTLANAYGGRWFDERWRPELDSPAWQRAVSLYHDLLARYGPPHPEQNGFNENLALFSNGHCAIWIDATVAAGMLFDPGRSRVASSLGFVHAPAAVTRKGVAWLWSWGLAIPSTAEYPLEAQQFIAWATSREYIERVARQFGWVAVPPGTRASTYANEKYLKAAPFANFVREAIEHADILDSTLLPKPYAGIQYVGIPEFPAIGTYVGHEMAKMLRGEQSIQEALFRSQENTRERMQASGYIRADRVVPPAQRAASSPLPAISAAASRW